MKLGGPAPRSLTGVGGDKNRLLFLLALFVVFAGGFVVLRFGGERAAESTTPEAVAPPEAPRLVREPAARIDFRRLAAVADATRTEQLVREPEAYGHLLDAARKLTPGDLEVLGLRRIDPEAILRDPDAHRGLPYEVRGIVESLEVRRSERGQEFRGVLRDRDGRPYAFTIVDEPEARVGDVARLQGFFFKRLTLETSPGTFEEGVIALVGRTLVPSFLELPPVTSLRDVPFEELRDYDLTDMVELQEDVLYQVLNYVRFLEPADRAEIPAEEVTWAELRANPEAWRGRVVRLLGRYLPTLQWQRSLGPQGENPLGVDVFHDGILVLPGERLVRWIGFEPIPASAKSDANLVHLVGIFVKNHAWENGRGDILNGPLVVPVRFERFVMPDHAGLRQLGYGIAIATGVLVLLFLVGVFADRKRAAEFRRDFLRRKKRRLARTLGETE